MLRSSIEDTAAAARYEQLLPPSRSASPQQQQQQQQQQQAASPTVFLLRETSAAVAVAAAAAAAAAAPAPKAARKNPPRNALAAAAPPLAPATKESRTVFLTSVPAAVALPEILKLVKEHGTVLKISISAQQRAAKVVFSTPKAARACANQHYINVGSDQIHLHLMSDMRAPEIQPIRGGQPPTQHAHIANYSSSFRGSHTSLNSSADYGFFPATRMPPEAEFGSGDLHHSGSGIAPPPSEPWDLWCYHRWMWAVCSMSAFSVLSVILEVIAHVLRKESPKDLFTNYEAVLNMAPCPLSAMALLTFILWASTHHGPASLLNSFFALIATGACSLTIATGLYDFVDHWDAAPCFDTKHSEAMSLYVMRVCLSFTGIYLYMSCAAYSLMFVRPLVVIGESSGEKRLQTKPRFPWLALFASGLCCWGNVCCTEPLSWRSRRSIFLSSGSSLYPLITLLIQLFYEAVLVIVACTMWRFADLVPIVSGLCAALFGLVALKAKPTVFLQNCALLNHFALVSSIFATIFGVATMQCGDEEAVVEAVYVVFVCGVADVIRVHSLMRSYAQFSNYLWRWMYERVYNQPPPPDTAELQVRFFNMLGGMGATPAVNSKVRSKTDQKRFALQKAILWCSLLLLAVALTVCTGVLWLRPSVQQSRAPEIDCRVESDEYRPSSCDPGHTEHTGFELLLAVSYYAVEGGAPGSAELVVEQKQPGTEEWRTECFTQPETFLHPYPPGSTVPCFYRGEGSVSWHVEPLSSGALACVVLGSLFSVGLLCLFAWTTVEFARRQLKLQRGHGSRMPLLRVPPQRAYVPV
eukprot:TRINITY_DN5923_c0_g1_i3.p1 TRINITY_DN5923_c0_g1~~TRINITY_DN5923_c0_g1_i3.p1  ORF type:complete len:809 (+),score=182.86 TRINITY_DN5923_c0_g1_i3:92-2518(+)